MLSLDWGSRGGCVSPDGNSPQDLAGRVAKLTSILDVAKAMAAARDLDLLLPLIIHEAAKRGRRRPLHLFVLDRETRRAVEQGGPGRGRGDPGAARLRASPARWPRPGRSSTSRTPTPTPRFNRQVDATTGYRTTHHPRRPDARCAGRGHRRAPGAEQAGRRPSPTRTTELLLALGGQASGAIENAAAPRRDQPLFEGFVSASVVPSRRATRPPPATPGGWPRSPSAWPGRWSTSRPAPTPSVTLHAQGRAGDALRLAPPRLRQGGRAGARPGQGGEALPQELEMLRARFALARKDRQLRSTERRLVAAAQASDVEAERGGAPGVASCQELDEVLQFILACNRPTVLPSGGFERADRASAGRASATPARASSRPAPGRGPAAEHPRGSLSADERLEIESHVTHTFRFLSQIPWTRRLRRVPEIAYAHHERLNGQGYPRKMPAETIPIAVEDDGHLATSTTPSPPPTGRTRRPSPTPRALDILHQEAAHGHARRRDAAVCSSRPRSPDRAAQPHVLDPLRPQPRLRCAAVLLRPALSPRGPRCVRNRRRSTTPTAPRRPGHHRSWRPRRSRGHPSRGHLRAHRLPGRRPARGSGHRRARTPRRRRLRRQPAGCRLGLEPGGTSGAAGSRS